MIFGSNEGAFASSKKTSKEKFSVVVIGRYSSVVVVLQLLSVKLTDGFFGNCSPYFPQYFTKAILLGDSQETLPADNCCAGFDKTNSAIVITLKICTNINEYVWVVVVEIQK